jgi:hypothetical protein
MSESIDYARNLRAIGQDLEARGITQFELTPVTDGYRVRFPYGAMKVDETIETDNQGVSRWRSASSRPLELTYSYAAIDRLDERGRAKRGTGSGIPDFLSLFQCLRALGVALDSKRGELLQLDRNTRPSTIPRSSSSIRQRQASAFAKSIACRIFTTTAFISIKPEARSRVR